MNVGAPLDPSQPCALTGWAVLADPALPAIDTPHGRVAFLQVVALHQDELDRWPESLAAIERHFAADLNDLDRAPVH